MSSAASETYTSTSAPIQYASVRAFQGGIEIERYLRLAFVDFDGARALAAAEVLPSNAPIEEEFIRNHCYAVVEAVKRICDWVVK